MLLEYIHEDYRGTIAQISNLLLHGEITFNLLYALLIPRTTFVTECPITGASRCVRLLSVTHSAVGDLSEFDYYEILCESIDVLNDSPTNLKDTPHSSEEARKAIGVNHFGRVHHKIYLSSFEGTTKIAELNAYPLKYHPQAEKLTEHLLVRGRKWISFRGIHHMQYKGTASQVKIINGCKRTNQYNVSLSN